MKSRKEALRFIRKLRVVKASPSLGGTESFVTMPARAVASIMISEGRRALGIDDGLLRLAVGFEDPEDMIEDLSQAL